MRRLPNTFVDHTDGKATLSIQKYDGNSINAVFPSEFLADIKLFHWGYKGKSGIFNEFNVSFAAFLADKYGYIGANWRRKDTNSTSYLPDNYQVKLLATGTAVKNWKPIADENRFKGREQKFYERMKWASKYTCESLLINVGKYDLRILVNSWLRQYIPTQADYKDGDLYLFDGTKLATHIIANIGGGPDDEAKRIGCSYTNRVNILDYRVDPNTLRYVDEPYSHHRLHRIRVEDKECIVYEQIDSPKDSARFNWLWKQKDASEQFLVGDNGGWRHSFVMFDAQYLNALYKLSPDLVIYYKYYDQEWVISERSVNSTGETEVKESQLKRVLLRESGAKVDYEYFEPRMTKAYAAALKAAEASEAFGEADRRRAKFENATGEDKAKMFVKPKVQHHRKIYAHRNYFCTEIYGGVGVWCKDLRCDSLLIGTNAQLQGVVVDSKQDIRKRRV